MAEQKNRGTLIDIAGLEDSIGSKGANWDPETEYAWTIQSVDTRTITGEGKDGHEGKPFTVVECQCTEEESENTIKQSFFYNKRVTINEEDKTKEADAVKFARGIGYPVGIDMPFKWKEIFRAGVKFKAHVKKQINYKTKEETGYYEIDLMTVKGVKGAKGQAKQASIGASNEDKETVKAMAAGVGGKTALIGELNKAGLGRLIQLAIQMDGAGELAYQ